MAADSRKSGVGTFAGIAIFVFGHFIPQPYRPAYYWTFGLIAAAIILFAIVRVQIQKRRASASG